MGTHGANTTSFEVRRISHRLRVPSSLRQHVYANALKILSRLQARPQDGPVGPHFPPLGDSELLLPSPLAFHNHHCGMVRGEDGVGPTCQLPGPLHVEEDGRYYDSRRNKTQPQQSADTSYGTEFKFEHAEIDIRSDGNSSYGQKIILVCDIRKPCRTCEPDRQEFHVPNHF